MKLNRIALAAAAVLSTAAIAAPNNDRIVLSAGASAIQGNLTLAVQALCTEAGGVPSTYAAGSNVRTIVCANAAVAQGAAYTAKANTDFVNFAGTNYAEFRLTVEGGSFTAIEILNGKTFAFADPAGAAASTTTTVPSGALVIGGALDVEPSAFTAETIGLNVIPADVAAVGVAQTFGIGVSKSLYETLFAAQRNTVAGGGATVAKPIPNACLVTDTAKVECIPTISKGQMASIMFDNGLNAAYTNGLGFLTGNAADNGTELRYIRRSNTSGTQASAQNYFLGNPCSTVARPVVPQPLTVNTNADDTDPSGTALKNLKIGAIRVIDTPSTGNLRSELTRSSGTTMSLGVLSGENNATANWRWVRIQGAAIGENAIPGSVGITNSDSVVNGGYDFYFETVYAGGSQAGNDLWATLAAKLNTLTAPVGLLDANKLSAGYNKGASACSVNFSN